MSIDYDDLHEFMEWTEKKSELKFDTSNSTKSFPIIPNCIYWAYMGCNVGSEEGKHRPVLITRTYKNSPICTAIPLTTQRLNDSYWYHIDLEHYNSTVLCEQMRIIDITRIDKPYRIKGKIISISKKDWGSISRQVNWLYKLQNKPKN